jgi:hypothetical protein
MSIGVVEPIVGIAFPPGLTLDGVLEELTTVRLARACQVTRFGGGSARPVQWVSLQTCGMPHSYCPVRVNTTFY